MKYKIFLLLIATVTRITFTMETLPNDCIKRIVFFLGNNMFNNTIYSGTQLYKLLPKSTQPTNKWELKGKYCSKDTGAFRVANKKLHKLFYFPSASIYKDTEFFLNKYELPITDCLLKNSASLLTLENRIFNLPDTTELNLNISFTLALNEVNPSFHFKIEFFENNGRDLNTTFFAEMMPAPGEITSPFPSKILQLLAFIGNENLTKTELRASIGFKNLTKIQKIFEYETREETSENHYMKGALLCCDHHAITIGILQDMCALIQPHSTENN